MPGQRAKTICKHGGCFELAIKRGGYCPAHTHDEIADKREQYRLLDEKKTPETKKFYQSRRWTNASKRHRRKNPLCYYCKELGMVSPAELCDHDPPLKQLLAEGKNPYDPKYFKSCCNRCHLQKLRAMKNG